MSNGPLPNTRASEVLISPYSGSSRRIQLNVTVSVGRKNAAQNANSSQLRPGRSVRASSQAISTASGSERSWRTNVTDSVLRSAALSPGSPSAARQPSSPYVAGCPGGATWKLSSTTSSTGNSTQNPTTASTTLQNSVCASTPKPLAERAELTRAIRSRDP